MIKNTGHKVKLFNQDSLHAIQPLQDMELQEKEKIQMEPFWKNCFWSKTVLFNQDSLNTVQSLQGMELQEKEKIQMEPFWKNSFLVIRSNSEGNTGSTSLGIF